MTPLASSNGYHLYVGADIASRSVSIAILSPALAKLEYLDIEQNSGEYNRLYKALKAHHAKPQEVLVVMESTGTYWMPLARYLLHARYAVSVVNPLSAKHYFRVDLSRDKNDKLDAFNLAELGAMLHSKLPLWQEPPPIYEELRQRLAQRDALTDMKVAQMQHRHAIVGRPVLVETVTERRNRLIDYFDTEIRALDKEIKAALLKDEAWGASAKRLLSITGIGLVAASWLLVATVNFTTCDTPEQAASFVGLVPRQQQSGKWEGKRFIGHSGHARLRHVLYIATISALRYNPIIKRHYERLIQKGKPGKVAVIAAERKLLTIAWACVKYERMFDPEYEERGGRGKGEGDEES